MAEKTPNDDPYRPDDWPGEELPPPDTAREPGPGCLLSPNTVTVFFLALTALVCACFVLLLINPYVPINPFPPRTPLPVIVVASPDPNQPTATLTPTKAPDTPELNTLAPTATPTDTLPPPTTLAPSATQVLVEVPPTVTATATRPPTATLIAGGAPPEALAGVYSPPPPGDPAAYTRAPFPFTIHNEAVTYIANLNSQGCNWASIAGSATDLAGAGVAGLAVHITGEGLDEIQFTGTAMTYGNGGYEIFLNGTPLRGHYVLQLISQTGAPISPEFPVTTSPLCEENVAIVNFVQNHDY